MNKKSQSLGNALLGIALVIVIFSAGFYFSGPKPAVSGAVTTAEYNANIAATHEKNGLYPNAGEFYKVAGDEYKKDGNYDKASEMYKNAYTNYQKAGLNDKYAETVELYAQTEIVKGILTPAPTKEAKTPVAEEKVAAEKEVTTIVAAALGTEQNPLSIPSNTDKILITGYYKTADGQIIPLTAGTPINQEQKETAPTTPDTAATSQPTTTYTFDIKSSTLYGITDNKDGTITYTELTSTSNDGGKTVTYTPKVGGTTTKLLSIIAEDVDWNKYAQTNSLTTKNGEIITEKDNTYTYTKNNVPIKTVSSDGKTSAVFNYKAEEGGTQKLESVTYTSPSGSLEIKENLYDTMIIKYGGSENTNLILKAAIEAGASSITPDNYEDGSLTIGGVTIKKFYDGIYSYSGSGDDKNVVLYTADGEKTTYTGVKFDDTIGEVDIDESEEYTMTTTDAAGKVTSYEKKEKIGENKFETFTATYKDDNTIGVKVISGGTTTVNMEFKKDGNYFKRGDVYFDPGNGEFTYSSEHYDIYEKNGKYYYKGEDGKEKEISASELPEGATDALREAYDTKEVKEGRDTISQKKWQQRFATFESILTEFSGLRGFSQLFWSDEDLDEWRESVDKVFASMYLGTDYWVSGICSKGVEREGEGTMYIETPGGLLEVGAHIEAEKTEPIDYQNGTSERLYKITYKVTNPEYEATTRGRPELKFNVYLYGDITVQLYSEDIVVEEGGSFSRMGSSAIVQYSSHEYDKVCIVFSDSILAVGTRDVSEVCNEVTMYTGPATEYQTTGVEVTSGGSGYGYGEEVDF